MQADGRWLLTTETNTEEQRASDAMHWMVVAATRPAADWQGKELPGPPVRAHALLLVACCLLPVASLLLAAREHRWGRPSEPVAASRPSPPAVQGSAVQSSSQQGEAIDARRSTLSPLLAYDPIRADSSWAPAPPLHFEAPHCPPQTATTPEACLVPPASPPASPPARPHLPPAPLPVHRCPPAAQPAARRAPSSCRKLPTRH